jgi:signal transduction histidine kinase
MDNSRSHPHFIPSLSQLGRRAAAWWQRYGLESADYRAWRHQFLLKRLRLGLQIAIPAYSVVTLYNIYIFWFTQAWIPIVEESGKSIETLRLLTWLTLPPILVGLVICWLLLQSRWGQRHPAALLLLFYFITNSTIDQIVGFFFQTPAPPDPLIFLAIALLIPVYGRLHVICQATPIVIYTVVYPLLGITKLSEHVSIYNSLGISALIQLGWVCVTSLLAVHWYEKLKRSEFETQRQLQVFLYSVSHDLQTPAMGTSMLLQSVLNDPQEYITLHRSVLEGLREGSDRQSVLIESLLDAHRADLQASHLHCQPLQISKLVDSLLLNLKPLLAQHEVQLRNQLNDALPLVQADENQLWRVYMNLITNALKHNPNQIELTLEAKVDEFQGMLCCIVQDNGVGIALNQRQKLFERYARGSRARYMPGLGLGLYICRMIVQAHGGDIDVQSQPGQGTRFEFTLPLAS